MSIGLNKNGNPYQKMMAGAELLTRDPATGAKQWVAPNLGKYPVGHSDTFINRYTSLARVYRDYDEALLDNRDNARYMWNDVGLRECIDSRKRSVALLNWHLEPEDETSESQRSFCVMMEKVLRRIKHFTEYRYCVQNAIWLGKMGIQHRWRSEIVGGKSVFMPSGRHQDDWGWRPLHGDKLIFRQQRPDMVPGSYEGQLGIRVGTTYRLGDVINGRWRVEPTDYGLGYFLSPAERRLILVHKHHVEDAPYEDGIKAGAIHGVGIRSVIYWEWVQKQETMAFLMEFVERMAGGVQIWKYPMGNQQALAEAKASAENYNSGQEHILLVPVPIGENGSQYGVDVIEPGFQGVETLQNMLHEYFNHRIKRYILGQIGSSETESGGLGSGQSEFHQDTLLQIIKSDATDHEETITSELVESIIKINVQKGVWEDPGFVPRFVAETEEDDVKEKLEACTQLMDRGIKFRSKDLYELVGMAMPGPGDEVNPDQPAQGGGMGATGMPKPGAEDPSQQSLNPDDESAPRDPDQPPKPDADGHTQRYSRQSFKRSAIPFRKLKQRKAAIH